MTNEIMKIGETVKVYGAAVTNYLVFFYQQVLGKGLEQNLSTILVGCQIIFTITLIIYTYHRIKNAKDKNDQINEKVDDE